ncbi:hypothetical protein [Fusibacter sp. JL216-2]|uniref:hypothetical protein n=1 Tax=Fusibacter sp. JL216-2 TaxID=3071453 RepID=UPI003D32BC35
MKNIMFWANVTSYIVRLVQVEYDMTYAVKAASLKYHVSESEILKHCELDQDTSLRN